MHTGLKYALHCFTDASFSAFYSFSFVKLATKGLSFEAIESAEAHLFEAVVADERIDEEKLGFAASVAADADVVEETPNRSLGLLADCVAAAVTRQAVAKRLASALCRLGSSNEGGVAGTFVQGLDSPSSDAVVGRATQIGRAHVVLERLAELPLASRKARLDRLVSCGKPSEVVLACDILAHRHATSNPAKKAVSDDILARLLAFDNTRKADELWNLNDSILGTLCEKYFPIFQGYLNFLLGRLRVALWEAWLSDAAVVDVAASAQRGSSSPATSPARTAHNQSVYGRLQEIADADCVEARLLICKVDQKRTPQEVLGEVEKRIKLLFNCCSCVSCSPLALFFFVFRKTCSESILGTTLGLRDNFLTRFFFVWARVAYLWRTALSRLLGD